MIGRNEGARLVQAIARAQSLGSPIVYADSASTDDSVRAVRAIGVSVIELDDTAAFTAARGRRAGLERLLAEAPACRFVQFIDGDCLIDDEWIATAVEFLEAHPTAAVVCGRRVEARPGASLYNRVIDQEWATPIGRAAACGGDAMMRVASLEAVGSFRAELMSGEEPELCARLRAAGWEVWRIDAAMTEHDAAITRFGEWWRRAERGGFGYAQVWAATRTGPFPLYARQMQSALLWAVVLPVAVLVSAFAFGSAWALALLPALYAVQISRIAIRSHPRLDWSDRIKAAALTMVVKLAETRGVQRYALGRGGGASTYKKVGAASSVAAAD